MRDMMRILATTYGLSVTSTPILLKRGIHGPQDVGNDVHGPAAHRIAKQRSNLVFGSLRIHPIVGGTGIVFIGRANKGEMLGAGDIVGAAATQVTIGVGGFVQLKRVPARSISARIAWFSASEPSQ